MRKNNTNSIYFVSRRCSVRRLVRPAGNRPPRLPPSRLGLLCKWNWYKNILLLLFFTLLEQRSLQAAPASTPAKSEKVQVQTIIVEKTKIVDSLVYPATVDSKMNAAINAESEGLIKKIWVQVGSRVRPGQTLLSYENPDPVYRYSEVKVKAPVAGTVSGIEISLMSKVEKGQKLLSLTDPDQLKLEIEIPASDLPFFKIGMRGKFRNQLQSNLFTDVELKGLAPLVDPLTGTAKANLELVDKKQKQKLTPGMVGQVKFEANPRENFLIPETAILYRDGKTWVRLVDGGKVKRVPIELGPRQADAFEISAGLSVRAEVIVHASRFIADGDEVSIEKKSESTDQSPHAKSL